MIRPICNGVAGEGACKRRDCLFCWYRWLSRWFHALALNVGRGVRE